MQQHGGEQPPELALDDQVVDFDPQRFGIIDAGQVLGEQLQDIDQDGKDQDDLGDAGLPDRAALQRLVGGGGRREEQKGSWEAYS